VILHTQYIYKDPCVCICMLYYTYMLCILSAYTMSLIKARVQRTHIIHSSFLKINLYERIISYVQWDMYACPSPNNPLDSFLLYSLIYRWKCNLHHRWSIIWYSRSVNFRPMNCLSFCCQTHNSETIILRNNIIILLFETNLKWNVFQIILL